MKAIVKGNRMTTPAHMRTSDGWHVVAAARRPPTFREQLRISSPPDLLPYGVMFVIGPHEAGCLVFAGCRYTEPYQINFANRFGSPAAKRAYDAIIAVPVQAPLAQVTSANLAVIMKPPYDATRELAYYPVHRAELRQKHRGRFALIKGEELVGIYAKAETAFYRGFNRFGAANYVVVHLLETPYPCRLW
jgi:hypothetical protein